MSFPAAQNASLRWPGSHLPHRQVIEKDRITSLWSGALRRRDSFDFDLSFQVTGFGQGRTPTACQATFPESSRMPSTAGRPFRWKRTPFHSPGWKAFGARRQASFAHSVTDRPKDFRQSSRTMAPGCTGFLIAMLTCLFSPRGEAKCVRGPSGRGASRWARSGVLDSTSSTASKRNEVMAVLSGAPAVRW